MLASTLGGVEETVPIGGNRLVNIITLTQHRTDTSKTRAVRHRPPSPPDPSAWVWELAADDGWTEYNQNDTVKYVYMAYSEWLSTDCTM